MKDNHKETNLRTQRHSGDEERTRFKVLGAISVSHFMNDAIQSLIFAIYPLLKSTFQLSFGQIGMITLSYQLPLCFSQWSASTQTAAPNLTHWPSVWDARWSVFWSWEPLIIILPLSSRS